MKLLKIMLITLILGGLVVSSFGCVFGSEEEKETAESQVVTVQRGNLTVDITAAGNLALSHTEDLAFDLFFQEGTVEEVLVEEGDTIEEGQALARLDMEEWDEQLSTLEDGVTAAERQLTLSQRSLESAERSVPSAKHQFEVKIRDVTAEERDVLDAERNVASKELAVHQAQYNLDDAEYDLSQIADVKKIQDQVDAAQFAYDIAVRMLTGELGGAGELDSYTYWTVLKANAESELESLDDEMDEILSGSSASTSEAVALEVARNQLLVDQKNIALEDSEFAVEDARLDVEDALLAVKEAELDVEDARIAVKDAEADVKDAQLDIDEAREDLADARDELDDASGKSPVITAPFAGFITNVNVEGGDEVMTGTVAVQLADPSKFEADILVSEMDILQVKLGGEAWVTVDAMQGLNLTARVVHIAPTATIQSGVVNYQVKVEVESLEAAQQERQEARQGLSSGELPERLKQSIADGQITQEQAEEMMKQRQQAQETPQTQMPMMMIPEDFQLREGLTVTVSIIVDEATDVLLVPNAAITSRQGQSYAQVQLTDGTTEERLIQTGISDWQFTEVTEGLSEGEEVVVPQGTTATTTTQQGSRGGPMPFLSPH